ncbi:serine/threonine protein kinase [Romboutsia weinsteinii]|uniref:Serine/threonine protein kinase n=1 Tax=Romboutsia weinsteinii TaxID=2020949 RepID=A0A371JAJ1_9FIRM|nr:serine/threonine-protein kinase [Romboutsia weinsteinii]RDY29789.1 serine/threonine protein kinase [Romboutsia weinsteinii]
MQISPKFNLRILKKINSEGVNSALYLAEDAQLGSRFILKQMDKKAFNDSDKYFEESKKIYDVKHPNIVPINYASYDDEYIYITMPYFERGSLYHLLENKNLTIREIISYSLDFLSAIYYIHSKGMLHCDIKPNNILISKEGKGILADFGSALYMDASGNAKLKNVYYKHIAPEQCVTSKINRKVDIYQIGTTLYRMCNGNEEYNKQVKRYKDLNSLKLACAKGKFPIRKKYLPHIPKSMIYVIEKCIKVNPEERYDDVLEIINDLSAINQNLDWEYKKIDKDNCVWSLNRNNENLEVALSKEHNLWDVKHNYENISMLDSKAKAYRLVRDIIKEYEKK